MKNRIRVFLVGGDLNSLRLYKQELKKSGNSRFHFCLNGTILLQSLEAVPEVIVLNCSRDNFFGLDVLRKIRKISPGTQVIISVSPPNIKIGRHALRHGAFAYIIKGDQELQQIESIMSLILTLRKEPAIARPSMGEKLNLFFHRRFLFT